MPGKIPFQWKKVAYMFRELANGLVSIIWILKLSIYVIIHNYSIIIQIFERKYISNATL